MASTEVQTMGPLVSKENENDGKLSSDLPNFWSSKRYLITLLLFFGFLNMYALRINISIAIVAMTSHTTHIIGNETINQEPEFKWNSETRGLLIGMSAYGYAFSVVTGYFVKKIGGCTSYGIGLAVPAVLCILSPLFLHVNFYLFLIGRFLEGIFEIFAYCSTSEIWANWTSAKERSKLISFSLSGMYFGMVVAFPFYGFLAYHWGWRTIFYVTGGIILIWCTIWFSIISNKPQKDKWISKTERMYLQSELENLSNKSRCSWRCLISSSAFWAACCCKVSYSFGYLLIVAFLPYYMKDKTDLDIQRIGFLSAIPSIASLFVTPFCGLLSDYLRNNNFLTVTGVHKLFICGGFFLCAFLVFGVSYIQNFYVCLILLVLFKMSLALVHICMQSLPVCMAPHFPSILQGYLSFAYSLGTFVGSTFYGLIVKSHRDLEWSIFFSSIGISMIICSIVFMIFGSAETQAWSYSLDNEKPKQRSLGGQVYSTIYKQRKNVHFLK